MKEALEMLSVILSSLSLMVALAALGVCLGMKWSSHKIEWRPLETTKVEEEEFESFTDPDVGLVDKALELSKQGKERKKKKDEDPLDSILESSNF